MGYRSLKDRILPILCCLAVLGVFTLGGPSNGSAAEDMFFKGKTIRIVVAFSVGGGFDLYSRAIGRHMGRYIPGNPSFLVQNRTGAGGLISANYVYRKAKPDGLTIGNFPGKPLLGPSLRAEGNPVRFQQVRVSSESRNRPFPFVPSPRRAASRTSTKWMNSPRPVKLSGTGPGNSTNDGPQIAQRRASASPSS